MGRKKKRIYKRFSKLERVIVYEIYLKILKSPISRQFNDSFTQSLGLTFLCYFSCYLCAILSHCVLAQM